MDSDRAGLAIKLGVHGIEHGPSFILAQHAAENREVPHLGRALIVTGRVTPQRVPVSIVQHTMPLIEQRQRTTTSMLEAHRDTFQTDRPDALRVSIEMVEVPAKASTKQADPRKQAQSKQIPQRERSRELSLESRKSPA